MISRESILINPQDEESPLLKSKILAFSDVYNTGSYLDSLKFIQLFIVVGFLMSLVMIINLVTGFYFLLICTLLSVSTARVVYYSIRAAMQTSERLLLMMGLMLLFSYISLALAAYILVFNPLSFYLLQIIDFGSGFVSPSSSFKYKNMAHVISEIGITIHQNVFVTTFFFSFMIAALFCYCVAMIFMSKYFCKPEFQGFKVKLKGLHKILPLVQAAATFIILLFNPLLAILCWVIFSWIVLTISQTNFHIIYYDVTSKLQAEKLGSSEILVVNDLKIYYPIRGGILMRTIGYVKAVNGVSFKIRRGETLALVGESGCGKTTVAKGLLGLVPRVSGTEVGSIIFNGMDLQGKFPPFLRRRIQFIFQDPDASLNPRMTIHDIIAEPLKNLNPEMSSQDIKKRVLELMGIVSLQYEHVYRFPHEFSGGQKQRIVIARALACGPDLLVLDEPTSALDVSVQAQILNLLEDLQQKMHLSYLFITHNLSVVHHIANRVAVMYLGKLVEIGPVDNVFDHPAHPYTRALLSARSIPDPEQARHRIVLQGDVPSPINPPPGCPFEPRCYYVNKGEACKQLEPFPSEIEPEHVVWTSLGDAPDSCWVESLHTQELEYRPSLSGHEATQGASHTQQVRCAICGSLNSGSAAICANCGSPL